MRNTELKNAIESIINYKAMKTIDDQQQIVMEIYKPIHTAYPTSHSYRSFVTSLVLFEFDDVIKLIGQDKFSTAHKKMYKILQKVTRAFFPRRKDSNNTIEFMRSTVKTMDMCKLAEQYLDKEYLDASDVSFLEGLQILNSTIIQDRKKTSVVNENLSTRKEAIDVLTSSIIICVKLAKPFRRNSAKSKKYAAI